MDKAINLSHRDLLYIAAQSRIISSQNNENKIITLEKLIADYSHVKYIVSTDPNINQLVIDITTLLEIQQQYLRELKEGITGSKEFDIVFTKGCEKVGVSEESQELLKKSKFDKKFEKDLEELNLESSNPHDITEKYTEILKVNKVFSDPNTTQNKTSQKAEKPSVEEPEHTTPLVQAIHSQTFHEYIEQNSAMNTTPEQPTKS